MSINSGFWDQPAGDRAVAMDRACELAGSPGGSFWDLDPDDRNAAYGDERDDRL